jgi:hypothetical protein
VAGLNPEKERKMFLFTYHYLYRNKVKMKILSRICSNLMSVNAHLFHRVAAHHFKVYICGSRNGIAILDSDRTLICLQNALTFLGSLIRQKGLHFSLHTSNLFIYEIFSEMAGFIKGSHWKIGAFFHHSFSRKNPFRSRNNHIILGFNQKPDCVLLMDADRKASLILKADRSQIPIVSFVDYTTPLASFQRITYPIPGNPHCNLIYQLGNLIAKEKSNSTPLRLFSTEKPKKKDTKGWVEALKGPITLGMYFLVLAFFFGLDTAIQYGLKIDTPLELRAAFAKAACELIFVIGTLRGGTPFTLGGGEDKPGLPQEEGEEISISTPLNMENPEPDGGRGLNIDLNEPAGPSLHDLRTGQNALMRIVQYLHPEQRNPIFPNAAYPIGNNEEVKEGIREFLQEQDPHTLGRAISDLVGMGSRKKESRLFLEFVAYRKRRLGERDE